MVIFLHDHGYSFVRPRSNEIKMGLSGYKFPVVTDENPPFTA
jgi:hypothetical protein